MIGHTIRNDETSIHVMVSELGSLMRIRIYEGEKPGPLMQLTSEQVEELIDALEDLVDYVEEESS